VKIFTKYNNNKGLYPGFERPIIIYEEIRQPSQKSGPNIMNTRFIKEDIHEKRNVTPSERL
jgi:hypothetical protein